MSKKLEEFHIGDYRVVRTKDGGTGFIYDPKDFDSVHGERKKTKKYSEELLEEYYRIRKNWGALRKWLEAQRADRYYSNDVQRCTAYDAALEEMDRLEGLSK